MTEMAYIIWKLRTERRIRDNDIDTTTISSTTKRLINNGLR